MKVILSRKGFDSSAGGCASPILPDGTMLSMPIPSEDGNVGYSELSYEGVKYSEILHNCNPNGIYDRCHLDPDIRSGVRNVPDNWQAAFGQVGNAQSYLKNADVKEGDIFLFFGWFHKVDENGHFIKKDADFYNCSDLHAIYGYLQVGEKVSGEDIKHFYWHPHSQNGYSKNNTLYLPSQKCSLTGGKGYGVLPFEKKRVLTLEGMSRAQWIPYDFLMPAHLIGTTRKNSSKKGGLYYAGQWQELVFESKDNPQLLDWVTDIMSN